MKVRFVVCAAVAAALLVVTGCSKKESPQPAAGAAEHQITMKIGISTNDQDPRAIAALQFAGEIEEKTGGNVKAELYHSGQLGGDGALIEALALDSGTVFCSCSLCSLPGVFGTSTYLVLSGISAHGEGQDIVNG